MKNKFLFIAAFLLFVSAVSAFSLSSKEASQILKNAENNTSFYGTDFSGFYSVIQEKPGEGRTAYEARMYRRDSASKWTILITGPESDRGKGYLFYDRTIWFYDPEDHKFTFTSDRDKFQNTNANTSDFAPQRYASDYEIESFSEVKLGNYDCVLFSLSAVKNGVEYPYLKLWISKDDSLVRKKEDYSLSRKKLRTTLIPSYQLVAAGSKKHRIPVNMIIQDNLRGKKNGTKMEYERTVISISNVSFEKVQDAVYTKPYLEMMSAR
ncbi:MAG: outer membrane lipoprotein-sorting protein [Treponema sp.]|nr:outer membrane lipoprotein-sorting protein [Treponema sp.]